MRRANLWSCRIRISWTRAKLTLYLARPPISSMAPFTNTRLCLRIAVSSISVSAEKRRFFRNHEIWVSSTRGTQILFHFTNHIVLRLALKDPMRVSDPEKVTYLISLKFISKSNCCTITSSNIPKINSENKRTFCHKIYLGSTIYWHNIDTMLARYWSNVN